MGTTTNTTMIIMTDIGKSAVSCKTFSIEDRAVSHRTFNGR
jgi:hypothetical protein